MVNCRTPDNPSSVLLVSAPPLSDFLCFHPGIFYRDRHKRTAIYYSMHVRVVGYFGKIIFLYLYRKAYLDKVSLGICEFEWIFLDTNYCDLEDGAWCRTVFVTVYLPHRICCTYYKHPTYSNHCVLNLRRIEIINRSQAFFCEAA